MGDLNNPLIGLKILAVDDEADILETIVDMLSESEVDTARAYGDASKKIADGEYGLVILDIMGVDGMTLLREAVAKGTPAVMLTAHAMNKETLKQSIETGALGYLPKEELAEIDFVLGELLTAGKENESSWKFIFKRLGGFFTKNFGMTWQEDDPYFWSKYNANLYL